MSDYRFIIYFNDSGSIYNQFDGYKGDINQRYFSQIIHVKIMQMNSNIKTKL